VVVAVQAAAAAAVAVVATAAVAAVAAATVVVAAVAGKRPKWRSPTSASRSGKENWCVKNASPKSCSSAVNVL
jgi:hypothetical protein